MMLADPLGWTAAALMVATFSCRDPLWMRPLAVCTNIVFIGYACAAGLAPVLALHALLLPINLLRWGQTARRSRAGRRGRDAPGSLAPGRFSTRLLTTAGTAALSAADPPHPLKRSGITPNG